ncbi:MAG: response regulator transcription factor [Pseudomonadota bacterium]
MSDTKILIVDDDPEITDALARGLQMHGYDTVTESNVDAAEQRFGAGGLSAAIVDVMIGADSGIDLVTRVRQAGHETPILMLSAMAEVEDRAAGLQAGADDYIVKPFAFDELLARLKVQQHRAAKPDAPRAVLEKATRTIRAGQNAVQLTEREFALLEVMHSNMGEVLSRYDIFDMLWASEGTSSENVVDVYIGYLRKKLVPTETFGFEINTIRNKGFVLKPL